MKYTSLLIICFVFSNLLNLENYMEETAMRIKTIFFLAAVIVGVTIIPISLHAQISHGGTPYSFTNDLPRNVPTIRMDPVNVQALLAEDRTERQQNRPVPPRFATAQEVNLDINNAGIWTDLPNGDRLWRLRIVSPKAHSIHLIFDRFKLPPGGQLFIYNEDKSTVLGAFTEKNNKPHGHFSTLPIKGALLTLEYYVPYKQQKNTELNISQVMHGYRNVFDHGAGFGQSSNCNINVNCSAGNNWQDEKRAVALIVTNFGQGSRLCTGALVNNERQDLSPYFLTAYHCLDGDGDGNVDQDEREDVWTWGFWFNYESSFCSNPGNEPSHDGMSGSDYVALYGASDFALLELSNTPPASYNTFYAGWNATGNTPTSSVTIHHPHGDIKKISIDNDQATHAVWPGTPTNSHWRSNFDQGTIEHGSSGAPLFDQNQRIVGQLHGNLEYGGGEDYCDIPYGWFGKLSVSWDLGGTAATRLEDWLDPDNTGIQQLNGIEGPQELSVTISGPSQVNEGTSHTWTASVSGGNPPYDSYIWYKKIGMSPWYFACTSSTTSCTTSLEDADSQPSQGYIKLEVRDEVPKYYGEDIYPVAVYEFGKIIADSSVTTIEQIPDKFTVQSAYPNPFNPSTVIPFQVPHQGHVTMEVFNLAGKQVAVLTDRVYEAGFHRITFDGKDLSSGTYFVRTLFNSKIMTQKIALIK